MKALYWILELFYPRKCVLCGTLLEKDQTDLCETCRIEAPEYPFRKRKIQFLDSFTAVWYYEGNVRSSLLRFKFCGQHGYADTYGRLLAMRLQEWVPEGFDVLTWVPVSPLRRLERGYDQARLIAEAVGRELGMTAVPALKKIRNNRRQSGITGEAERRANVLGVYRIRDAQLWKDRRVLLVDDILTTGSTASECARVLLTAGAKEVHCAAVAAARKDKKV